MASFIKKTFILAVSLICFIRLDVALATSSLRQPRATGHTLVPGISVAQGTSVPPRVEMRTFIQNPTYVNIFLLCLQSMQADATNNPLSFYMISGIHGTNYAWDGDNGGDQPIVYGYCRHADRLFPTWHRPYLSLYEKTCLDRAIQIVQTFPEGPVKNAHLVALQTWRIPYWDWAMNASVPDLIGKNQYVVVTTAENGIYKNKTIYNPLFSCPLNYTDPNTMVGGNSDSGPFTVQTVRNGDMQNNVYVSLPSVTYNQMILAASDCKSDVYNALTLATDYNSFSNMEDDYYSIEFPHGGIHTVVGGDYGHMTYPSTAAFDPIFYLHHANVDRLFAIWQAIYPNSYLSNRTTDSPNQDTELHPFRKTENQYWTSKLARDTKNFGYTYPELASSKPADVIAAVNKLYGPTPATKKQKRDLSAINNSTTGEDSSNSAVAGAIIETRNEYITHIKASNCHIHGSYTINFYFGDPASNETHCAVDPNCVGHFKVFARKNLPKTRKKLVKGTCFLTDALYERLATGELQDMTPKTIKAYLKTNFKWAIAAGKTEGFDPEGLEMTVVTAEVKSRKDEYSFPVWGKFSPIYKAV